VIAGRYDVTSARKAAEVERELEKRFRAIEMAFQMGQMDVVWDGVIDMFKVDASNEVAIRLLTEIYVNEEGFGDKYRGWVRDYIDEHRGNAAAMGNLALALLGIADLSLRLPELALEAARAAYERSEKSQRIWIEVFARSLYQIGALDRAIAAQEEAVVKASDAERDDARRILDYYKTCKRLQSAVQ